MSSKLLSKGFAAHAEGSFNKLQWLLKVWRMIERVHMRFRLRWLLMFLIQIFLSSLPGCVSFVYS
jgi:hypothetical protein